ncbi:MAG TPA: membrane protein insertase YidC [Thermodesulfovibrionales bacterium]|nr:membrane protein insertase YidC [Thermodesulfovibrionales bacterium]
MDKRTFLAILLTLIVLMGYQFLFTKPEPRQPLKTETRTAPETAKEGPAPLARASIAPVASEPVEARDIKVETDFYIATLTTRGGTMKDFELKKYKDPDGKGVSLLKKQGLYPPFGLGTNIDDFSISNKNFVVSGSNLNLTSGQKGSITFEYSSPPVSVRRVYTFYGDHYRFDLKDEVSGIPEYWLSLGSDFGIHDHGASSAPHIGPVILKDNDRIELDPRKLGEPKTYKDGLHWIAQEDKYFFASIVPSGQITEAKAWKLRDSATVAFKVPSGANSVMIYAGPKEYERLKELHVGLEHIVDFGFFSLLARPLFWILKFFYKFIGNYGWAIVLLTIMVRIPFIPLINKGQKSMKRLQELQPRLNEMREKYKKDPQRMQKETMELYKKYKVNPVGGCLPMLLQIPVFFALYKVLMISIELRGAPFIFWITDLSGPDTLFGHIPSWFPMIGGFAVGPLPLAMGLTMVIQQKMTPSSADPTQAKMMMLMPIVFTFLFLNFASGLVLYWLVNNVFGIVQQFYVNRKPSGQQT